MRDDLHVVDDAGGQYHARTLKVEFDLAQIGTVDTPGAVAVDSGAFDCAQVNQFVGAACRGDANFAALRAFDEDVIGVFVVAAGLGCGQVFRACWAVRLGVDGHGLRGRRGR